MTPRLHTPNASRICAELPRVSRRTQGDAAYLVMELAPANGSVPGPIRFHLYHLRGAWLPVGIERVGG